MNTISISPPPEATQYPVRDAIAQTKHASEVTDILVGPLQPALDLLLTQTWVKTFRHPHLNRSMLHIAAKAGNARSVEKLLSIGFDPNDRDAASSTPLVLAAHAFNLQTVQLLIAAGADPHYITSSRRSALHHAAQFGSSIIVNELLALGVDVNSADVSRSTPLHLASQNGHINNIAALLDAGADIHAKDSRGWTPFRIALKQGHERCAWLLGSVGGSRDVDAPYAKTKAMQRIAHFSPIKCAVLLEGLPHLRRSLQRVPDITAKEMAWAQSQYRKGDDGAEDQIAFLTAHMARQRMAVILHSTKQLSMA